MFKINKPKKAHQRRRKEIEFLRHHHADLTVRDHATLHHHVKGIRQKKNKERIDGHGKITLRDHLRDPRRLIANDPDDQNRYEIYFKIKNGISIRRIHVVSPIGICRRAS